MNILMLLENPFPPDIRVQKEAAALTKARHKVFLLCPTKEGQKEIEEFQNIKIIRFNGHHPTNFFQRKFIMGFQALTLRNLLWSTAIIKLIIKNKIDVLHVHDLLLLPTALAVKKEIDIPVIADLHENYPELLRIKYGSNKMKWKDRLLVGADRWVKLEPELLHKVDHIIVVVEEAKERLEKLGISSGKITIISNSEALEYWDSYAIDRSIVKQFNDSFVISYIGGFGVHRGIDTAIHAMRSSFLKGLNLKLLLVGAGGWYSDELKRLANQIGVSDKIEFIPWVPIEMVRSYMEVSNIGLVPHNSTPHTETTVPHKLFQYMLFGKPLVVSSCRPLKRIVEQTKSGLVFCSGDEDSLAEKISSLFHSQKLCRLYGQNGETAAIYGKYSWTNQADTLLELYSYLLL